MSNGDPWPILRDHGERLARVEEAAKDFTMFKVLVGTALVSGIGALIVALVKGGK